MSSRLPHVYTPNLIVLFCTVMFLVNTTQWLAKTERCANLNGSSICMLMNRQMRDELKLRMQSLTSLRPLRKYTLVSLRTPRHFSLLNQFARECGIVMPAAVSSAEE